MTYKEQNWKKKTEAYWKTTQVSFKKPSLLVAKRAFSISSKNKLDENVSNVIISSDIVNKETNLKET